LLMDSGNQDFTESNLLMDFYNKKFT